MNQNRDNFEQNLDATFKKVEFENESLPPEYIALRNSNDSIRKRSSEWLKKLMLEITSAFNAGGANIEIFENQKHRFKFGQSRFSGSKLELKQGVRCLTLETGWTQGVNDGILPNRALACAQISHFGFKKSNESLLLLRFEDEVKWYSAEGERSFSSFDLSSLRKHFERFLL